MRERTPHLSHPPKRRGAHGHADRVKIDLALQTNLNCDRQGTDVSDASQVPDVLLECSRPCNVMDDFMDAMESLPQFLGHLLRNPHLFSKRCAPHIERETLITTITAAVYTGTSFIRNSAPLGPYGKTMPRTLWWS